jgi:hypothetical protein
VSAAQARGAEGKRPPPPPRAADDLPRPVARVQTGDLEFDLPSRPAAEPQPPRASPAGVASTGRGGRVEIEFNTADQGARLELDLDHGKPAGAVSGTFAQHDDVHSLAARGDAQSLPAHRSEARGGAGQDRPGPDGEALAAEQSGTRPMAGERGAAGPMSRAELVHPVAVVVRDPRVRQIALLRVLGASLVGACGVWLDSSIGLGNASTLSVIAHAVGIYQLGLGLRGLWP